MKKIEHFYNGIYKKWSPTNKIFFWLAIIAIIATIFLGTLPFFIKDNSTAPVEEKLVISPNPKSIECNGWDQEYSLKITNNYDYALYDIVVRFYFNRSGILCNEPIIKDEFQQRMVEVNGWQIGVTSMNYRGCNADLTLDFLQFQIQDLNPHSTLSYLITIPTKNCKHDFDIVAVIMNKDTDSSMVSKVTYSYTDCDQETFLQAEKKFEEKDYNQAIILYKKTLNISESNPMSTCVPAMIGLFDTYALMENFSESKYWADKIPPEVFEQNWELAEMKGDIYLRNNLFNDAIPIYELVFPFFNYSKTDETLMRVIHKYCACKERAGKLQDGKCYVPYYSIFASPNN